MYPQQINNYCNLL